MTMHCLAWSFMVFLSLALEGIAAMSPLPDRFQYPGYAPVHIVLPDVVLCVRPCGLIAIVTVFLIISLLVFNKISKDGEIML